MKPVDFSWQTAALRSPRFAHRPLSTAMRSAPNNLIALHSGYPTKELLPERLVRSALTRAARTESAVSAPPTAGLPELQSWFAQELSSSSAPSVSTPSPSDAIIVPGSQSGLSSIFQSLVGAGHPILAESPTYWGAIRAAENAGVEIVPVPSGPDGPDPEELDRAFEETGARLFYAQPNYANPTGALWSAEKRTQVLDIIRQHGAYLIEDDWAHDFGITSTPVPVATQDNNGHVIYIRSLTKSVSPALRVAAVIVRGPARERILASRAGESLYVSGLLQTAALDVVTQPGWQTHLRGVRQQLRSRRDLLVESLNKHARDLHLAHLPTGGLNLWLQLPDGVNLAQFTLKCEQAGVVIAAGTEWFPAEPTGSFVRLNYSGPNPAAFPEAARILGQVLEEVQHPASS